MYACCFFWPRNSLPLVLISHCWIIALHSTTEANTWWYCIQISSTITWISLLHDGSMLSISSRSTPSIIHNYYSKLIFLIKKQWAVFFIFIVHSCMALWFLWCNVFSMLVFLIAKLFLTRLQWNLFCLLPYVYSTSLAIFRLELLHNLTL